MIADLQTPVHEPVPSPTDPGLRHGTTSPAPTWTALWPAPPGAQLALVPADLDTPARYVQRLECRICGRTWLTTLLHRRPPCPHCRGELRCIGRWDLMTAGRPSWMAGSHPPQSEEVAP